MKTLREALREIVFSTVGELNDNNTDIDLLKIITEHIVADKMASITSVENDLITGTNNSKNVSDNENHTRLHGVWLYSEEDTTKWTLRRFIHIEEAIKEACIMLGDIRIIRDGKIVSWDILKEGSAFYIEEDRIKLVEPMEVFANEA